MLNLELNLHVGRPHVLSPLSPTQDPDAAVALQKDSEHRGCFRCAPVLHRINFAFGMSIYFLWVRFAVLLLTSWDG